jgi:hypothetical protein
LDLVTNLSEDLDLTFFGLSGFLDIIDLSGFGYFD